MNNHEYFGLCASHDWYFQYSDDSSVYSRGRDQSNELMLYLREDKKYEDIYDAWADHIHHDGKQPDFEDFK